MLLRMNPAEWRIWLLSFQKFLERKGEVPQPPLEVPFTIYKVYPYQFFYICSSVIASLDLLIISIFCFHLLKEFEDKKTDDLKLEEKSDKADSGMDEDSQPYNALGNCASYVFVTYQEHSLLFPIFFFLSFRSNIHINQLRIATISKRFFCGKLGILSEK